VLAPVTVRVAALYDVHGNLPALDAVLAAVPSDAVIVVGGDVAAGPFPAETVDRLRRLENRVLWLRGNADRELTPTESGLAPAAVLDWVRGRLGAERIEFLHALPPSLTLEVDGIGRVLFVHATPRNDSTSSPSARPNLRSHRVSPVSMPTSSCAATLMSSSNGRSQACVWSMQAAWAWRTRMPRARTGRSSARASTLDERRLSRLKVSTRGVAVRYARRGHLVFRGGRRGKQLMYSAPLIWFTVGEVVAVAQPGL
jgi:hypothetical protein